VKGVEKLQWFFHIFKLLLNNNNNNNNNNKRSGRKDKYKLANPLQFYWFFLARKRRGSCVNCKQVVWPCGAFNTVLTSRWAAHNFLAVASN